MKETYCGKNCSACKELLEHKCEGCKKGPGRYFGVLCDLAKCCQNKGHNDCLDCDSRESCSNYRIKDSMPEVLERKKKDGEYREKAIIKRAPVLEKWLMALFVVVILSNTSSLLYNDFVYCYSPALSSVGMVMGIIASIASWCILFRLSVLEDRYGVAGVCLLIVDVLKVVEYFFFWDFEALFGQVVIACISYLLTIVSICCECMGHSLVLIGLNEKLSEEWNEIWKVYILLFVLLAIDSVVMFMIPLIGKFFMIFIILGFVGVTIVNIANLYLTACVFKNYKDKVQ